MASGPWPFFSTLRVCSFDNNGQLAEEVKNETNVDLKHIKSLGIGALAKEMIFYSAHKYCLDVRDAHSC